MLRSRSSVRKWYLAHIMENPKPTSVCLIVRTQSWFTASVVLETIPPLNTKLIDEFPAPAPNTVNLRSWIGKGPCSHKLGGLASLYFDHGEEIYPTFTSPSVSPKGASCYAQTAMRTLNIDEHTAIFCLEAAVAIPADPNLMNVEPKNLDDDASVFVTNTTRATKNIVDSLVGGYALY